MIRSHALAPLRLLLAALLIVLAVPLVGCGQSSQSSGAASSVMAEVRRTNVIRAGWAPYPPYAELDPATRRPKGFYIDLFNRVAQEAGYRVEWVETTWGNMVVDLRAGRFQVMAAPVFRTIPRATQVAFTRPIDFFGLSAVTRADNSRISSLGDLRQPGLVIAVTQGEVGQEYAARNLRQARLREFGTGDIALALNDVIEGRAEVGIADSWTIRQFVAQHPGVVRDVFGNAPFNQVGAGWFVSPDQPEFLQFLNTSIDWLISSGTVAQTGRAYQLASQPVDR